MPSLLPQWYLGDARLVLAIEGTKGVQSALHLGWCVAETRGRNRPDGPPGGTDLMPSNTDYALPLRIERTRTELRIERRRYQAEDLKWISICTKLRATGMPIRTIKRYAELVSAGPGNEQERLALLEAHRAEVTAKLAELQENLEIIDHKIDVYQGRLAAGDADQLWAPKRLVETR